LDGGGLEADVELDEIAVQDPGCQASTVLKMPKYTVEGSIRVGSSQRRAHGAMKYLLIQLR